MAPFNFLSVGATLLARSFGLFSSTTAVRSSCIVPVLKHFSTTAGGPPKRPLTAYMQYIKEQQPIVIQQNPDIKPVDIIRRLAQQWRVLTPEQKRPFEETSLSDREQYKVALQEYQAHLTPAQAAAAAEERRQKVAKRKANRKKRELNNLGKPKRPRTAFNIFMSEHFEEAKGSGVQSKMKSLMDDWKDLHSSQRHVYVQLAEDDKVRYKNEMKAWEEHMTELGREDLIRQKEKRHKKAKVSNGGKKKKSPVKVVKASAPVEKTAARPSAKKTKK